jgi:hypothetical protein
MALAGMPFFRATSVQTERNATRKCLEFIYGHSMLRDLPVVVILEGAPATMASNLVENLNTVAFEYGIRLFYMQEIGTEKEAVGVLKTGRTPEYYRWFLVECIESRKIAWDANIVSLRDDKSGIQEFESLLDVILGIHWDEKAGEYTSKGENPDDRLSALCQFLYYGAVFWNSNLYAGRREKIVGKARAYHRFVTTTNYNMVGLASKKRRR